jgi:ComF family protein
MRHHHDFGLNTLVDLLLPRHCVLCGFPSGPDNLCAPCAAELPRIDHSCRQCGLPLRKTSGHICGLCLRRAPPWDLGLAALSYCHPVDHLVSRFKFNRDLACGHILGRELTAAVQQKAQATPTCILPVPLHRGRQVIRTFNQADLLARQLAKKLGVPVCSHGLERTRRTPAQSGLDAASRRKNLRGAFRCMASGKITALFGHVALVDDVLTTGSTLAECTRVLKRAGAGQVSSWVAAVTPAGREK